MLKLYTLFQGFQGLLGQKVNFSRFSRLLCPFSRFSRFSRSCIHPALGLHLHLEHGFSDPLDFDKNIKFAILEVVNPSNIEVKEYNWMHQLNTFQPVGINTQYPFDLSYIGK